MLPVIQLIRQKKHLKKILEKTDKVYYFLPIFEDEHKLTGAELERHINFFPVLVNRAETSQKGPDRIPWNIVFSKYDKPAENEYLDQIPKEYLKNYVCVSANTGEGLNALWENIIAAN